MAKTFLLAGASSAIAIQTSAALRGKGHRVIGISTKEAGENYDEFYRVEKYTPDQFPALSISLDGLVYFPGSINLKPFSRIAHAEFLLDFEINCLGAVALLQTYLTHIKRSGNGSVVFLSSVAAQMGLPFHTSVALSKGGLEGLTKALAAELAPSVRVNCVAPSLVNTPLGEKFINTPEKLEQMQKRNPMRKVGSPQEVASAIVFLLTEDSSWVTGQILAIDGGMGTLKN